MNQLSVNCNEDVESSTLTHGVLIYSYSVHQGQNGRKQSHSHSSHHFTFALSIISLVSVHTAC